MKMIVGKVRALFEAPYCERKFFCFNLLLGAGLMALSSCNAEIDTIEQEIAYYQDIGIEKLQADVSEGKVMLSWAEPQSENFSGVEITFSPPVSTLEQPIKVSKGTKQIEIGKMSSKATYTFNFKSLYDKDEPPKTRDLKVAIPDYHPPSNISAQEYSVDNQTIAVIWEKIIEDDFKEVEITFVPPIDGLEQPIKVAKGSTIYELTGLENGTEYVFSLRSVDTLGNKSDITLFRSVPRDFPPPKVGNFKAIPWDTDCIKLSWGEFRTSDVSKVVISYNDKKVEVPVSEGREWIMRGLSQGVTYTFSAKAIDESGKESLQEAVASASTTSE